MIIMKFGGTSVGNSEAIARTIEIVRSKLDQKPVVVVSAMSKVTDTLYKIADKAREGDFDGSMLLIGELRGRHEAIVRELISDSEAERKANDALGAIFNEMATLARAVSMLRELTPRSKARVVSYGEILSSTMICHIMNFRGISTSWVNARHMIITDNDYLKGRPVISDIERMVPEVINKAYNGHDAVITQGFVSATIDGEPTILGRGGSDYTASLIGMALDAKAIEIWTDVDGVRTADPRRVHDTRSIEKLSFEEAAEMAHFGAKVLHPLTIEPAVMKNIPVYVLNSTNPLSKGTAILQSDQIEDGIKSLSFKENIYLLNIFSMGMIEVSGFLSKVFKVFADNNVSVDLISTSEANLSLTVDSSQDISGVVREIQEFASVNVHDDKSQVSIIGKNVVLQRGVVRWAMTAFNNVDIHMITQGTSLVNISFVVDRCELDTVLPELHKYLFEFEAH